MIWQGEMVVMRVLVLVLWLMVAEIVLPVVVTSLWLRTCVPGPMLFSSRL